MAKRFKLRLSRVLQICRSEHPPAYPQHPSRAAAHWLFPANPKPLDVSFTSLPAPPPSTPDDSFIARHVASVRCTSCAGADSPSEYTWEKDGRWHVVSRRSRSQSQSHPRPRRKICGGSRFDEGDVETTSPVLVRQGDRRMKQKKSQGQAKGRTTASVVGRSVTSSDSGLFSWESGSENNGDEEDETDALLSTSISFSNDTLPEYYRTTTRYPPDNQATKEKQKSPQDEDNDTDENRIKRLRRYTSRGREEAADAAGEKRSGVVMGESVAVVKRSENPLEDFKRSMAEMIAEKRMFGAGDLEQLLQCFLSLNSRQYHGVIVEAFAEIWQVLFFDSRADTERRRSGSSSTSAVVERC
ncbi:transcription repressor OFP7-like [Syzygium oleosum]|uniref:transcription repressor OFP7-like n=1 Tax=Syzygium oleosum TaxID=219896 RepID=UPI0011D24AAB|nr:transcription repressor OFP7-like [Syzygium oleosum]